MPIGSNNKIPSASVAEDRNQRPSGGNRTVAVTGKATTQSSNPVSNNGSGSGGDSAQNVFEQILKTPSLFPEVASQIAQLKVMVSVPPTCLLHIVNIVIKNVNIISTL